jgi:hemolysin III
MARPFAAQAAGTPPRGGGGIRQALVESRLANTFYTRSEELANWLTHGVGALFSAVAVGLLIFVAVQERDTWRAVSFVIYGVSLVGLYVASTLYHLSRSERRRWLLRRLDHAAIFILIAGTYTPFLLIRLRGPWGWSLFAAIWTLCGTGALLKMIKGPRHELASTCGYLVTGWLILVALKPMLAAVPIPALWLLLAGGFFYTTGVAFYLWETLRFHHAIWHGFVLGGSMCHFAAVALL